MNVVPLRVREGDVASCLNLNRAQRPRLLGVKPELLAGRFTFANVAKGLDRHQGWQLLQSGGSRREEALTDPSKIHNPKSAIPAEVPAIGDANAIEWALGKEIGDTIDYTDEQGRAFKVRLVGAVANSILQGSLLIDEAEFTRRFPGESGYRMFLIDAPSNSVAQVSATLSRALQDAGLELTPAAQRLNEFNAVQNTYLGTFQILGGLGLLLGSAGLGRRRPAQRPRTPRRTGPAGGGGLPAATAASPRVERARRPARRGTWPGHRRRRRGRAAGHPLSRHATALWLPRADSRRRSAERPALDLAGDGLCPARQPAGGAAKRVNRQFTRGLVLTFIQKWPRLGKGSLGKPRDGAKGCACLLLVAVANVPSAQAPPAGYGEKRPEIEE